MQLVSASGFGEHFRPGGRRAERGFGEGRDPEVEQSVFGGGGQGQRLDRAQVLDLGLESAHAR